MTELVMTIKEVATALKLTEKTVYSMVTARELPAFKVRGQWRLKRDDFNEWLARQSADGPTRAAADRAQSPFPKEASRMPERPAVEDLSARVPQDELHRRLVRALGTSVVKHAQFESKPFEMELAPPLPQRVRAYMYNATRPPGGRPLGEHKVQLIVPGQSKGDRGSFDHNDGRIVLLIGYTAEEDVFIVWDAGLYSNFAWSRNVQVKAETIIQASAGKLASQDRQLRPSIGPAVVEKVLAVKPQLLAQAIIKRMELTRERLLRD